MKTPIRVRATRAGYYGDSQKKAGDEFDLLDEKDFSDAEDKSKNPPGWMHRLSKEEVKADAKEAKADAKADAEDAKEAERKARRDERHGK